MTTVGLRSRHLLLPGCGDVLPGSVSDVWRRLPGLATLRISPAVNLLP
jgi:hypothetical protein